MAKNNEIMVQKLPDEFLFPLNLDQEAYEKFFKEISKENKLKEENTNKITENKKNKNAWQYTVKKGETLWQISKKFNIPLRDLLSHNGLTEKSIIKAGDKIYIPGIKPQAVTASNFNNYVGQFKGKFVTALKEISDFVIPASGFNWGEKHAFNGTDISAPCGAEVYAAQSGTVIESKDGWNSGYGNYIIIRHNDGSYTLYGHLSLRVVEIGYEVEKGELIGYVGNTGYTIGETGCHLHFEVRGRNNPLLR